MKLGFLKTAALLGVLAALLFWKHAEIKGFFSKSAGDRAAEKTEERAGKGAKAMENPYLNMDYKKCLLSDDRYAPSDKWLSEKPKSILLCEESYSEQYDLDIKEPLWVETVLLKNNYVEYGGGRKYETIPNPIVPNESQQSASSFINSDYVQSRASPLSGAFVPDGGDRKRRSEAAFESALYATNSMPLTAAADNLKKRMEWTAAAVLKNSFGSKALVFTGPVFMNGKSYGNIGGTAIPTYFFFVYLDSFSGNSIAFIVPNEPRVCESEKCGFLQYQTTLSEVEKMTGIDLVPVADTSRTIADKLSIYPIWLVKLFQQFGS